MPVSSRLLALSLAAPLLFAGTALAATAEEASETEAGGFSATTPEGALYGDYLAGLVASRMGDYGRAATFFGRVADNTEITDLELLRTTYGLLLAEGRLDRARTLTDRMLELDAEEGLPHLLLAVDALDAGRTAEAAGQLRQLGEGGLAELLTDLLGSWAAVEVEGAEAAKRLDGLAARRGLAILAHLQRALLLDYLGDAGAAEAYQTALDAAEPPSLRLVLLAGNFYERQGEAAKAETLYETYRTQNPEDLLLAPMRAELKAPDGTVVPLVQSVQEGAAAALFDLAGILARERGGQLSMAYANLAMELDPDFQAPRILLGELMQEQGRHEDAIAVYQAVPEASAYRWVVGLRIAEEMHELERTDEAIEKLRALAEARPDRFEPWYRIGNFERSRQNWEAAATAYESAYDKLDGDLTERHWALLYFRGIAYERSKQWQKAEEDFLKALDLNPEQPYVLNYLAYSWIEQEKNLDRAEDMLVRAVELRPTDGYIVDSLGWVYYRLGRYEEAVEQLERAVELRPMDPTINDHLGDAYWRTGRRREARVQWQRALSLDPTEDGAVEDLHNKLDGGMPPEGEDL
jgi:tetratricopeptide (TPR) repeat protein